MEGYPSNSHKSKAAAESSESERTTSGEKKVERVVSGDVLRRKKPLGKRFMETFVGGDARSVWNYVLLEVLIPAAKDAMADAITQGIERVLFGEVRSSNRRGTSRTGGYVSYNRYSSPSRPPWDRGRDERPPLSRRARAQHDFDEIILPTRREAEEVIDNLFNLISKYDVASVADLYDLVGITPNFTDNKWGWADIRGADVTRVRNGYLLDLPKPEPLS